MAGLCPDEVAEGLHPCPLVGSVDATDEPQQRDLVHLFVVHWPISPCWTGVIAGA